MESKASPTLKRVVKGLGGQSKAAHFLGTSRQLIHYWLKTGKQLPAEHVLKVEAATGIQRHVLRPDVFPAPVKEIVSDTIPDCPVSDDT